MTLLVGRRAELAQLRRLAASAAAGAGGVIVVEGDAGIGKTALLDAFAREIVSTRQARVLRGRAWEEGGAPPYWPWQEIASAGGWPISWDGHDDQFGLYAQVLEVAREEAAAGPLVLLVDDIHAADEDTLRLTRYLARSITATPIALMVAARPSDRLAEITRLGVVVPVGPLSEGDADRMIDELATIDTEAIDAEARVRIRRTAEGNPLFVRELTRSAQTGRAVPADIVAVVTPVLDRQRSEARDLIELSAVLGRTFPVGHLAAISGRPLVEVLELLEPMLTGGTMSVSEPPTWMTFSHQLVRDVLYHHLTPARRLELHADAARGLEPASEEHPAEWARHLLAAVPAVEPDRAVAAALRAAGQARARMAYAVAAGFLERAVDLTSDPGQRHRLLLDLGLDLRTSGRVGEAWRAFDLAIESARQLDGFALADAVLARTELVGWEVAALDQLPIIAVALAGVTEGGGRVPIDGVVGDPRPGDDRAVRLRARRAAILATASDLDAALAEAQAALDAAHRLGPGHDEPLADALAAMHRCCWRPHELALSTAVGRQLVEVATRLDDVDRLAEALLATFIDQLRAGDVAGADAALDRYAELAARTGRPRHQFFLLSRRAMRAFLAGRLAEGERLIERAYELGQRIEEPDALQVFHGARMVLVDQLQPPADTVAAAELVNEMARAGESRGFTYAALLFLRAGEDGRARAALADLVQAMPSVDLRSMPLFDLCLVAEVAATVGVADLAGRLWSTLSPYAGIAVVNAGAVTFGGVVDEYLGRLALALGRPDDARPLLAEAIARYQELGARVFEARAAGILAALDGGPSNDRVLDGRVLDGRVLDGRVLDGRVLDSDGGEEPAVSVVFRRRDDGWEIGIWPRPAILRDARGLQHLHALLRAPGRDIPATELAGGGQARELAAREAQHALLDDRAKAAYRERIRSLQEELDEADSASDIERSSRLRAELDLLLDELHRAVGLLGRDRYARTTSERARVTVRKAIAASIERIADHDPRLASLLRSTVKTGHLCSYGPNPLTNVRWTLD